MAKFVIKLDDEHLLLIYKTANYGQILPSRRNRPINRHPEDNYIYIITQILLKKVNFDKMLKLYDLMFVKLSLLFLCL